MKEHFIPEGVFQKVVIFNKKGQVLLLQASKKYGKMENTWDLPGGKVHVGETLEESIKREVKEETGASANSMQLFDVDVVKFADGKTRIGLIYFAKFDGIVKLSFEHNAYQWIRPNKTGKKLFSFDNISLWIEKAAKLYRLISGR